MTLVINPYCDHNNILKNLFLDDIEPGLTRKEFIFSFEKLIELINNNINLLDDSYNNIHSDLEYIDRQIDEIGGRRKALKKVKFNY